MNEQETRSLQSRREFCGLAVGGALGALSSGMALGEEAPEPTDGSDSSRYLTGDRPIVALVRDSRAWTDEGLGVDGAVLRRMVDRAVCTATGEDDANRAWRSVVTPTDVVGIKPNCLGGRKIATQPGLVKAVVDGLLEAGIPAGNIIVWECTDRDLDRGGFPVQKKTGDVRYLGTRRMCPDRFDAAGIQTQLCELVTDVCTVLINMPALKAHHRCGLTGAIKNYVGAVSNPSDFHDDFCQAVADLYALAPLRTKSRLVIMDALRPLYDKGPNDYPHARWKHHGVLASTDPVAIDRVGQSILEAKRQEVRGEPWPMDDAKYLLRAGTLGLGQADLQKVNIVRDESV